MNNKTNKQILNEAFFKKPSYSEKIASKMPQYKPVSSSGEIGGAISLDNNAMPVLSTDEVKRRLATGFGVSFGNNNVRSMATKALKTFPIVVSDNLEPETVVMLKKLMEDQYAEYISLLISNKVVDLSNYETGGEDGNIAIQALDSISGSDFSSTRVANKAANTGKISTDDVFANIPLYNLLRENQMVLNSGDVLIDTLLENALVVPSEDVQRVVNFIQENANVLVEYSPRDVNPSENQRDGIAKGKKSYVMPVGLNDFDKNEEKFHKDTEKNIVKFDLAKDALRGFQGLDKEGKDVYTKLTNAEIVVDKEQLQHSLNRSVGEMITLPENKIIKDRFEKATYLLHSNRIAGKEYIDYVTLRLGLPISQHTRQTIINNHRAKDTRHNAGNLGLFTKEEAANVANNRMISSTVGMICRPKIGSLVSGAGFGAGLAGGTAAGISAIVAGAVMWPAVIGVAVGGAVLGLASKLKKFASRKLKNPAIEGWERVEALINVLDRQRAGVIDAARANDEAIKNSRMDRSSGLSIDNRVQNSYVSGSKAITNANQDYTSVVNKAIATPEELNKSYSAFQRNFNSVALTEAADIDYRNVTIEPYINEELVKSSIEYMDELFTEIANDSEIRAIYRESQLLSLDEASLTTSMPLNIKYIEKKPDKDVLITPAFMARSNYAYGSTEIERRENKDRRYNQPLIMTVKFKERFSDGKYSDNELTAVIGILGKIIRVPSEEMKYILKSNADGDILKGFLGGDIKNTVSDLLTMSKISKEVKNLPQSADMWKNLEKVATLASTNAIAGKRSGNIANAHIVFSQKEVDEVRSEEGIDYLRDMKNVAKLMKKYSAFTLMIANDAGQRVYIYDDLDDISWNVVPYSALMGKDSGDQLTAALAKLGRI